jgi:hypothetical protein
MRRQHVESSAISSVGYDADAKVLEVEFSSGAVYKYREVPPGVYRSLMKSDSKGKYVSQRIRDRFPFTRIEH